MFIDHLRTTFPRAAIDHECQSCELPIKKGERYKRSECVVGDEDESTVETTKWCASCKLGITRRKRAKEDPSSESGLIIVKTKDLTEGDDGD